MARECGCRGGNQNCTFCYGEGYIGKHYGRATQTGSPPVRSSQNGDLTPFRNITRAVIQSEKPRRAKLVTGTETHDLYSTSRPFLQRSAQTIAIGKVKGCSLAAGQGFNGPSENYADRDGDQPVQNYWFERRLDGSRDYSQFREGGRFGSHPAYDECDDESAP